MYKLPISHSEQQYLIQEEIRELQKSFNAVKRGCLLCLQKKDIKEFVYYLKSLKADNTEEHKQFTESYFSVFSEGVEHSELFGALNFNMNYFSHQLLDCFITEFHLKEVKQKMKEYKSYLKQFCEKTPATLFCQAQAQQTTEPPPHFRTVIFTLQRSESLMLGDVEQFRQEYSSHYGFKNYTMTLASATVGSITVTWFIPESVVGRLQESVPREILRKYSVTKVEIAGGCVYRLHTPQKVLDKFVPIVCDDIASPNRESLVFHQQEWLIKGVESQLKLLQHYLL